MVISVAASSLEIPLRNWTVPAYRDASASGTVSTMTDVSPGIGFVAMQPCRIADTRGNGAPIQGGIFANGEARDWTVTGLCGIPTGADAVSVNFTVIGSPGTIPAGSFLLAWPTGQPPPPTAIMTYGPAQTISNAAIVALNASGQMTVNVSGSTHVIMDVNGYFTDRYNAGVPFRVIGNVPPGPPASGAIIGINTSTTTSAYATAGLFEVDSCGYGAAGVNAFNASGGQEPGCGPVIGVWGGVNSSFAGSAGVVGTAYSPEGIVYGVAGGTNSTTNDSAGVLGVAYPGILPPGRTYGVIGESKSPITGSAGVLGIDTTGSTMAAPAGTVGVRGDSRFGTGVIGFADDQGTAQERGVSGQLVDSQDGTPLASGHLGYDAGDNNYAVFAGGDYGGTGAKYFVEPHPSDASKVIRYVALEGPEAGTYFRGRGRFQNGLATIEVPEDFRLVTDPESLSVVATPIGEMATVAVTRVDLDRIVLRGSRNVEFFYLVNGVRKTHKNLTPIVAGSEFMPKSADAKMPAHLTAGQKAMLISNGTYNADGTVNVETARRLGWDRMWQERSRPRIEPESETSRGTLRRPALPRSPEEKN
jgi:hypothetical protein